MFFNILEDRLQGLKVTVNVADDRLHAWLSQGRGAAQGRLRSLPVVGEAAEDTSKPTLNEVYCCTERVSRGRHLAKSSNRCLFLIPATLRKGEKLFP